MGTFVAGDGVALRYIATPVQIADDPTEGIFVAAYDLGGELAEINDAARIFLIAAAVTVGATAIVGLLVAGRLLRPLRELRATAERITATASTERIPVQGRDDVSELTRTVNDMLDRLDGTIESQRRLLDDVGHELKTPITIVRGHLELLDPDDPVEVEEARTLAIDELDRMSSLVGDITDMVQLGSPSALQRTATELGGLTRSIIAKARALADAEVREGPIAEGIATLDPARVTQAVLQLAQNAVTHAGGRFTIGSYLEGDAGDVRFTVADQGPGIPDDQRERIFERFSRVEHGRGRSGSGLGLAIVDAIAIAHGGRVELTSTPGFGAAFSLVLPLVDPVREEAAV
jgi:signal transduction histidine kinase